MSTNESKQLEIVEIRIRGHLGEQWSDWFEGMTITLEAQGDTLLAGPVSDDAALHGLLKRIRDLGMPLISVNRVAKDSPWEGGADQTIVR